MITVCFNSELQKFTGIEQVKLEVHSYRELVAMLSDAYGINRELLMDMAVAIDGLIVHEPFLEKFANGSEIHFMHRISGG